MKFNKEIFYATLKNNLLFLLVEIGFIVLGYLGLFALFDNGGGLFAGLTEILLIQFILILIFFLFMVFRTQKIKGELNKIVYLYLSYIVVFILIICIAYFFNDFNYLFISLLCPLINYLFLVVYRVLFVKK